jgi:formylglycine-generating enzyme required for sulfatase activity
MGSYLSGQEDYPVAGVSWYEAAAYARWAGKSLPTIYHWSRAAGLYLSGDVVPASNINGKSLLPLGASSGITRGGTTDMAATPQRSAAASAPAGAETRQTAAETHTAATPAEAPAGENVRSAAELKADWGRLLKLMRERDKMTEALLNSCTVAGMEGQVLRLTTSEFVFKKIANDSGTREKIEDMLAEVLG